MKFWKNTTTLDVYVKELQETIDAQEAEFAVIGSKPIPIHEMPNLKMIFKCGVGTDNVPFEEAQRLGVEIVLPSDETQRIIFEETANFAVFSVLRALYRETGDLENWDKFERPFLGNRKVLIVGLGRIGEYVRKKLYSLVEVKTFDLLDNKREELESFTRQADVVTLHIPLNDNTQGFWNKEKLSWMKDGAVLVNTSRGPIVNELHLLNEIKSKRIKAVFDVYWEEPYHGPLRAYHPEYFHMSPHIASTCDDFLKGLASDLYKAISKYK
jgi:phosphoglycerate dehydrogenase-like enzyme